MDRFLRDSNEVAIRLSELEYRNRINKVIAIIWNNPDERFRLDTLASAAGFSPFHFHRIFAAFVGETLGEYIRRIKIINASHSLVNTKYSVTEIALSAGYETPAAFAKAFRKFYGVSPSQVRSTGRPPVLPNNTYTKNKRSIYGCVSEP